jgi:hypothetical protein
MIQILVIQFRGNMCGPAEISSAEWEPKVAMSGTEHEIIKREMDLKLC